jgi:hypothetical protein
VLEGDFAFVTDVEFADALVTKDEDKTWTVVVDGKLLLSMLSGDGSKDMCIFCQEEFKNKRTVDSNEKKGYISSCAHKGSYICKGCMDQVKGVKNLCPLCRAPNSQWREYKNEEVKLAPNWAFRNLGRISLELYENLIETSRYEHMDF